MPVNEKLCECGCGGVVPTPKQWRKVQPRFINGHFQRTDKFRERCAERRMAPPDGWTPPSGLCECGCGRKTAISRTSVPAVDQYAGHPKRFVHGHNSMGAHHHNYKGGRTKHSHGYVLVKQPDHPRANPLTGYVYEHVLVAERALGRHLPDGAEIHHVNGIRDDNRPANLVICPDHSYHMLIELRQRAFSACGNAEWRRCWVCQEWDDPAQMKPGRTFEHRECRAAHNRERRAKAA